MKKCIAVVFSLMLFCCIAMAQKDKAEKKDDGGGAVNKNTFMNFGKGDQFTNNYADTALVEEHLTGKEKARMKVSPRKEKTAYNGSVGVFGMSKNVDWSKFNYVVFNCFVEGDKPWKGTFMVGDKSSYAKWGQNYAHTDFVLKPGENKEVHIGISGLFSAEANRPIDMTCVQVFEIFAGDANPSVLYFGNLYLVYEEE